ncbi:dioxygenase [Xylanimonas sp. McL0601]|uniref:dioxygenase family protein n=1 Tax=Xylanimonas sp. McL0601 TaxID=3414739 RepID=UPI003CEDD9EE
MSVEKTAVPALLFEEARSAEIVGSSFAATPEPRLQVLLTKLVEHLHAYVKDVRLTPDEWEHAIQFLTATGQKCTDVRQEFILLSDTLGISMLVESLAGEGGPELTEATVEGPFHMVTSPDREHGADLNVAGEPGEPLLVTGRVTDETGNPVVGAKVDVWHANADGFYDVQKPDEMGVGDLRAMFTTDSDGRFWFRSIVPAPYPIPTDGPVGSMLRATGRHEFRPAHVHFQVGAAGLRTLTTHIFVAGSPHITSDAVFGVKESLIFDFATIDDAARAAEVGLPNPFRHVDFPVVLHREDATRDATEGAGG